MTRSLLPSLKIRMLFLGGLLVQLMACVQAETTTNATSLQEPSSDIEPGFQELARAYREAGKLLVIYGSDEPELANNYQQVLQQLSKQGRRRIQWQIYAAADAPTDSLKKYPSFLIGTGTGNPLIQLYEENLPISLSKNGFEFKDKAYEGDNFVFQLSFYPSPANPRLPVGLIIGTDDDAILSHLGSLASGRRNRRGIWSRMGYELFRSGKRIVMGVFDQHWQSRPDQHWDFEEGAKPIAQTEHFQIFDHQAHLSRSECADLEKRLEEGYLEVADFLGKPDISLSMDCHLYGSGELMGLKQNQQSQGYLVPEKKEIHLIYNQNYEGNIVEPENHLILRASLGIPNRRILETGMCNLFSEKWQKHGALYWAARLQQSNNALPLVELLGEAPEGASYLVRGAMGAALVQFLIDSIGKEAFLEQYANWNPSSAEIQQLEPQWRDWLSQLPASFPVRERPISPGRYFRGMTFAHEGYNIYNGYGSTLGKQSLEKIAGLHANSIAIVPYSGTREVYKPVPFRLNQWAGGENDAAVIATYYMAKEMGMQTLLKPQIWFPGAWPGEVEMKSEADWKQFFAHYRRWIRHYAMLAEIHEMDMFCVGVEFAKTTISHPEEWRSLVKDMRGLYQGPITYAANWGEEIEKLAFGDELDFIGVDNYYPLSKRDRPSDETLREGFESTKKTLKKVHKRFKKPIIFTEVGFRSIEAPWKQPHEEANGADFSGEDQARCYQVILEGIQGEDWINGLFWWKWPSYMGFRGEENVSFSPCGKEAEAVLREGYRLLE